jgi:predicted N-acetyltransferase YhbS
MSDTPELVRLSERPELAAIIAGLQTEAFPSEETLEEAVERVSAQTAPIGPGQVFILLEGGVPIGTASFTQTDMVARPDLTPWLASVYMVPAHRGRGLAVQLVRAVEMAAREAAVPTLWLFTDTAAPLYARLGWIDVGQVIEAGKPVTLMRRDLAEG